MFVERLSILQESSEWTQYLKTHPDSTPFHQMAWLLAVARVYAYDIYACVVREEESIRGICPLVHVKTPLFGNALISTAFGTGGGILADTPEAYQVLQTHIQNLGHALGVDYIECRTHNAPPSSAATWHVKSATYAGYRLQLEADTNTRMQQFRKKKRNEIRKALKNDLTITYDVPVETFYATYARSLRDHGTPVHTVAWYRTLLELFNTQAQTCLVTYKGQPVCACLAIYHKDSVTPHYSGGVAAARPLKAFDAMYWSLMETAIERGSRVFDFGRSKYGTGAAAYKEYWGFEPKPLTYQYYMPTGGEMPNINPNNPKYAMFVKIWQHIPLFAANTFGPFLAKQLG